MDCPSLCSNVLFLSKVTHLFQCPNRKRSTCILKSETVFVSSLRDCLFLSKCLSYGTFSKRKKVSREREEGKEEMMEKKQVSLQRRKLSLLWETQQRQQIWPLENKGPNSEPEMVK